MSWFIRNIRDVQWYDAGRFGVYGDFEQGERFPEFGFNFGVVWPGQPVASTTARTTRRDFSSSRVSACSSSKARSES